MVTEKKGTASETERKPEIQVREVSLLLGPPFLVRVIILISYFKFYVISLVSLSLYLYILALGYFMQRAHVHCLGSD